MVAPPGWSEPAQNPQFDEITLMLSGRKRVEVNGETLELHPGEVLVVYRGSRVRYANPFPEPAVYWSICLPAFAPHLAGREPE
ncbi:MAG: cupin domain-containing protein [Calditrichaeota bacterium]|nr:MAG: cupin domain-containing protein [Calditrichota bacterium]